MKTLVYSTLDAKRISTFKVDDFALDSIINQVEDKHYFRFLFIQQRITSKPYPQEFSMVLLNKLGSNANPPDNTAELDLIMLKNLDKLFEKSKTSKHLKSYIKSFFTRYQGDFKKFKGYLIMVISQADTLTNIAKEFTHLLIENHHCYSLLGEIQSNRLFQTIKKNEVKKMVKLVYSTGKNTQAVYKVESSQQAASVLKAKEDALYYDFLLKNQKAEFAHVGPNLVSYVLSQLNMEYVECKTSSCLDLLLIDKAADLFEIAKQNHKIKRYLEFNFRVLHQSFINTVLKPLMVISNQDVRKDVPDTFIGQSINKSYCYYDKMISHKDIHTIFDTTVTE